MTKRSGFTLIELLVVISIISVLSSIAITSLGAARSKAQYNRAKQEILQIAKAVEAARANQGSRPLIQITGSGCSYCAPDRAGQLQNALTIISNAGGGVFAGLNSIIYDPLGQVYLFDENENEGSATNCTRDTLTTYSTNPPILYRFEYGSEYCKLNPIGVAGFQ